MGIYDEDSFFTLSQGAQIGLVAIAVCLALLCIAIVWRLTLGRDFLWRLCAAFAVIVWFEWLSPQVFYTYYLFIFEGLPNQLVINRWPDLKALIPLMTFTENFNLSFHARGLFAWALIAIAIFRPAQSASDSK